MRLFYLTALDEEDREKCGVLGKIKGQISSFKQAGIDVHFGRFIGKNNFVIEDYNNRVIINAIDGNTRKRVGSIYDELFDYICKERINVIYIRFISLSSKTISFYKKLKRNNVRVIIEFYSHNLELEARKTATRNLKKGKLVAAVKGYASLFINKCNFSKLHTCVDLIVTTTKVPNLYGLKTINVVNGIDVSSCKIRSKQNNKYDFNIISVAMISPWHGYDRVIKGLAQYYENGGEKNILYTVIGDGEEKANLVKMVRDFRLEKHVLFTGIKLNEELASYYDQADIALEMLAGFRRTKGQISSIKMAEYFSKGIPVVYAADDRLYPEAVEKYCYWVCNDDSPVNIDELILFCSRLYHEEHDLSIKMHGLAAEYFDWSNTMRELIEYILKEDNNGTENK